MSRRPRVDPRVPTRAIDRKLARTHVATPDAQIIAMTEEAFESSPDRDKFTPTLKRQTVRYALWRHEQNYLEFARVMAGH